MRAERTKKSKFSEIDRLNTWERFEMRATCSKLVVMGFYVFGGVRGYDAQRANACEVGKISKGGRNTGFEGSAMTLSRRSCVRNVFERCETVRKWCL